MPEIETLDQVVTLKVSKSHKRRLKAKARDNGMRFGVWARTVLLAQLEPTNGKARGNLAAPVLPK